MNSRRRSRLRATWLLAVTSCAISTGCLTGISRDEIPEAPIAFLYYDVETSRLRSEQVEDSIVDDATSRSRPGVSIAEGKEVANLMKDLFGVQSGQRELQGRLALIDARSGELKLVEGVRKGAVPQDWSADRERLLFTQVVRNDLPKLFELELATGRIGPVTRGREAHPEGCYGPNGGVVYTSVNPVAPERNARVMFRDPLEKYPRRLSPPGYAYYPTCAPDGSAVAYTFIPPEGGPQQILIQSLEPDAEPRLLSRGKDPAFSRDGSVIAFSAKVNGKWALWRIRPDGKGRKSLGHGGRDEHRPSLSPDNRLVVYVVDSVLEQTLYLRRADGSGDRILYSRSDGDRPVW